MKTSHRTVTVFVVLFDGTSPGPAGDGTHIARFRREADAKAFAAQNTCYGQPATYDRDEVPEHIAQRWSIR